MNDPIGKSYGSHLPLHSRKLITTTLILCLDSSATKFLVGFRVGDSAITGAKQYTTPAKAKAGGVKTDKASLTRNPTNRPDALANHQDKTNARSRCKYARI